MSEQDERYTKGPIAWVADNSVAANLLMLILIVGGLVFLPQIKQEVFPEVQLNTVTVRVPYPGATPEEVEQGIVIPVEESIREVDGVETISSFANEGYAFVVAELFTGEDTQRARNDIESAVSRITTFPENAEDPEISIPTNRKQVISLVLYGDIERRELRQLGETARTQLLQKKEISVVNVNGLPPPEISIEVPQKNLRKYNLTLSQIAERVRNASVELPGGSIETSGGEILLRTTEERESGEDFRDVAVVTGPGGSRVTLRDIGTVKDTFKDTKRAAFYNGKRSVRVEVFRVGKQTPTDVSNAAREFLDTFEKRLPPGVKAKAWNDSSEVLEDRINLLLENSLYGLVLVLIVLGLFLEGRLAFWTTLGIPVTFFGAVFLMPSLGVSINMLSLFAFLLTLGIVVDDAIVVGEAAFKHRRNGYTPLQASVEALHEVGRPVIFAVLTTIIAFSPLLFVPGIMGKFFANIPMIVIPILVFSLVECLIILPAHLSHKNPIVEYFADLLSGPFGWLIALQERFSDAVERFVDNVYRPMVRGLLRLRYVTLSAALALLLIGGGYVAGGFISINFLPKIEGDIAKASIEMPVGTPVDKTRDVMNEIIRGAEDVIERNRKGNNGLSEGIISDLGVASNLGQGGPGPSFSESGSHLSTVAVQFVEAGKRQMKASDFVEEWREEVGDIPGVDTLSFTYDIGPSAGSDVAVELQHENRNVLERAAEDLADRLESYSGVYNVNEGFQSGKEQLNIKLKPSAKNLGISEAYLANQISSAFFGAEAKRDQRGREELRIYVRRPEQNRTSEHDLESMMIQTPRGGEIPLEQAAYIERGTSYTEIERENGNRAVDISGTVNANVTTGGEVMANLQKDVLPDLMNKYAGLDYETSGRQQERDEAMSVLLSGMAIAILVMFSLMAIAFRSYAQPFLIIASIPFGLLGALGGHILMGYNLSMVSFMGMVALSGVVVNDCLVLIAKVNDLREEGYSALDAVVEGGKHRFRPILLTSLTTFFGLTPMILETSIQARFLIPMAISLGFGVLFVTVIALIIVPALYMAFEDVYQLFGQTQK
jgi:multidrug efflux pump subunit AcrB